MAFDGIFTGTVVAELKSAVDSHIDKIYQPSSSEICLSFRKKGFFKRLIISVKSGFQRIHFTDMKLENPEKPPMFCMLLRKHFSSARLIDVSQKGFERLIEFTFESTNEMGDRVNRRIVCELIGNMSNVILLDENGKIIDALKRSDISAERIILSGAKYEYPKTQDKLDPKISDTEEILGKISELKDLPLSKAILDKVGGISPLVAREIVFASGLDDKPVSETRDISPLKKQIEKLKTAFNNPTPFMLIKDGSPFDFSFFEINQYGNLCSKKRFSSFGELLDSFYMEREKVSVRNRITGEVSRLVENLISRAVKRMSARENELVLCEKRDELRIKGELIKANIGIIKSGQKSVVVQNFYDENLSLIEIKLDPALSPQNNASKYFKEYKKKAVAAVTLNKFIEDDKREIEYLSSVAESLTRCESVSDLNEIKNELKLSGYIRSVSGKKQKSASASFKEYKSPEGYRIIVGKNNLQNDFITTKMASKNDMWFHTKNIHGSHVVVFSQGGDLSDETILFAAKLAAKNSKASSSSNVPVDYTQIRYVKKPSGAKPGMVIYTNNNTIFVTPESD